MSRVTERDRDEIRGAVAAVAIVWGLALAGLAWWTYTEIWR